MLLISKEEKKVPVHEADAAEWIARGWEVVGTVEKPVKETGDNDEGEKPTPRGRKPKE